MNEAQTFQTEFHTEDAFVSYLASVLPSSVFVGAMFTVNDYVEPGVYVGFMASENVSEGAGFTGHIEGVVNVLIRVHANGATDDELKTSRQQFGELYSRVIYHLAQDNLRELVNAEISEHASVDKATIEGRPARGVDADTNSFEGLITLGVIARAVDA